MCIYICKYMHIWISTCVYVFMYMWALAYVQNSLRIWDWQKVLAQCISLSCVLKCMFICVIWDILPNGKDTWVVFSAASRISLHWFISKYIPKHFKTFLLSVHSGLRDVKLIMCMVVCVVHWLFGCLSMGLHRFLAPHTLAP